MLHVNDYSIEKIVRRRQVELEKQARIARLLKEAKGDKPALREHVLSRSGELLILLGQKLKDNSGEAFGSRMALQTPCPEGISCD